VFLAKREKGIFANCCGLDKIDASITRLLNQSTFGYVSLPHLDNSPKEKLDKSCFASLNKKTLRLLDPDFVTKNSGFDSGNAEDLLWLGTRRFLIADILIADDLYATLNRMLHSESVPIALVIKA